MVFSDSDTRDFVLSHARNLAGKSDMGVRIDVPPQLLGVKRALYEYGYILKNEIGIGFKRNVRYEDAEQTLVTDVFYPSDKKWERINFIQAKAGIEYKNRSLPPRPHRLGLRPRSLATPGHAHQKSKSGSSSEASEDTTITDMEQGKDTWTSTQ